MYKTELEEFEETGREVYQVTRDVWIQIHSNHILHWINATNEQLPINEQIQYIDINKRLCDDVIESSCFHKEQVERALRHNIEVSEEVLKDYAGLKEKIQAEQKAEQDAPRLTKDIFEILKAGDKITVNNYKLTVDKKEENSLILRIYKKRKQGIKLIIGDKAKISIGW